MIERCLICQRTLSPTFSWWELFYLAPFRRDLLPPLRHWLCKACRERIPWIRWACARCSRPMETEANDEEGVFTVSVAEHNEQSDALLCDDCRRWLIWEEHHLGQPVLERNVSVLHYDEWTQELVRRYKFGGDERLCYLLAAFIIHRPVSLDMNGKTGDGSRTQGAEAFWEEADLITAIPLSPRRLQERGFNQAARVAEQLARRWDKPFLPNVLIREDDEGTQSKKGRRQRLQKMFTLFLNNPVHQADIKNKRVIVIDDIYTTGATLHAAAYTLRRAGAGSVLGCTIAR